MMRMHRTILPLSAAIAMLLVACGPREEPPVMGAPLAAPATVEVPPPGASRAPVAKDDPLAKKSKAHDEELLPPSRDGRRSVLTPRKQALLATELEGLTRLLQATPATAVDRPQLLRRIAEDYVELEYAATLEGSANAALEARRGAIATYTALVQDHPSYPQRDEALYYLAFEEEQANDLANARKRYFELIQKYPQSKLVPNAYLAFGEMFFAEAGKGDPSKYDLAEKAYEEVLKYPPPENKAYGYANYMLAQVGMAKGDNVKALAALKKTIDFARSYPQVPNATRLADFARRDLTQAYSLAGDPSKAFNFFRGLSGDGTGETQRTFEMMERLGTAYSAGGRYSEASAVYQDLRARDAVHSCRWSAYADDADQAARGTPQSPLALQNALHACGP